MGLLSLGAGVAIGYVIGTKTGKEKFDRGIESVKTKAQETWEREDVQDFVAKTSDTATKVSHDMAESTKKAATAASDLLKKAAEKADEAEEKVSDVVDEAEDIVQEKAEEFKSPQTKTTYNGDVISDPGQSTERKGTDWANEGGAKP
ncbi:hypothetical protein [Nesterenkonia ebinurensis]|uniref:hypothetical protein n=1 Tax=Nesterenkonia ebinurensis TaxID=2608252 RepID=UPI00123D1006|nr:hypothetical protein [Nesterenkonia ebinurensis]